MKYRAEIDGLRALAVVPVILFHAGFELFSGGFVGVDVFFVISGYLITTILIEDIENKSFSIINFYERRARRILPALFFVILVCIPFAWMCILPIQLIDFSQSLVAVSLFASNILFWQESGYFETAAEEKPLLHTWSLAVEEQYYIVFPIFLILAWRFGKNRVFWMIVAMASISLLLSEWGWRNKATANFYLAPTRAWELFAGSIAAFIVQKQGVQKNNPLALVGLGAIIFSIFFYDETTPFPSVYALVPVLGVVLLVLYADKDTIPAKLLGIKAFVGIGLISYSAYLWHQPLFAFARVMHSGYPSSTVMAILSGVSMVLAYLSWRFVESYYRKKQNISAKMIFVLSLLGLSFFTGLGTLGHFKATKYKSGKFHPYAVLSSLELGEYVADNRRLQLESWDALRGISDNKNYSVTNDPFDKKLWFNISDKRKKILLIGNSHSKDIFNILYYSDAFNANNQLARFGLEIHQLDEKHRFWESKNYQASSCLIIATRYIQDDIEILPKIIERVILDGKKILLVENIFEFPGNAAGYSLIDEVVFQNLNLKPAELALKINHSYYDYFKSDGNNRSLPINAQLLKIADEYQVPTLNRMDYICSDTLGMCHAVDNDLSKNFFDYGHHTLSGSRYFSNHPSLVKFLKPLEWDKNE